MQIMLINVVLMSDKFNIIYVCGTNWLMPDSSGSLEVGPDNELKDKT
jgi:hypothetical protein